MIRISHWLLSVFIGFLLLELPFNYYLNYHFILNLK